MKKQPTWNATLGLPFSQGLCPVLALIAWGGLGCGRTDMGLEHVTGLAGGSAGSSSPAGTTPSGQSGAGKGGAGGGGTAGIVFGGSTAGAGAGGGGAGISQAGSRGSSAGASTGGTTSNLPLWRNSREPFCPERSPYAGPVYVWSDGRGVFAVASNEAGHPTIWANSGTGWQSSFAWPGERTSLYQGQGGLSGFPGGALIVYGGWPCGIQFVDSQGARCSGDAMYVKDVAVVDNNLAYAVHLDRLLQFDGDFWSQVGNSLGVRESVSAVWADRETVVVAGGSGQVTAFRSGKDPVQLPGLPEVMLVAAWGFGASDIWVASGDGELFQHDGKQWARKASLSMSGQRYPGGTIIRFWGQAGALFVIWENHFGRWDGTRTEILDTLNGEAYFQGVWGNSPSEVFLGVHDANPTGTCPVRARWWNGSVVSPL